MTVPQLPGDYTDRRAYSDDCEAAIISFRQQCSRLSWRYGYKHDKYYQVYNFDTCEMEWAHDKGGPRIGVIAVYCTHDGQLFMGTSRCHKRDKFDRSIGVYQALRDAFPILDRDIQELFKLVPKNLQRGFAHVLDRFHTCTPLKAV